MHTVALMQPYTFAESANVSMEGLGTLVAGLVLVSGLLLSVRKLFGWDKEGKDVAATKAELDTIAEKVGQCATKTEVNSLRDEMSRQYGKLEEYARSQAHGTLDAVNNLHVNMEKMRVEVMKEIIAASEKLRVELMNEVSNHSRRVEEKVAKSADILEALQSLMEEIKRDRSA